MEKFYAGMAEIFEIEPHQVTAELELAAYNWDSLAVVSTIALADDCFDVMLSGQALGNCATIADIESLIRVAQEA